MYYDEGQPGVTGGQGGFNVGQILPAVTTLWEGYQNRKQSQKNLKNQQNFNLQQAADARAYNLEMWHMSNQYNSPREQMARLKAAGLNPNLAYGSGNVAGLSSGRAPEYVKPDTPDFMSIPAPAISKVGSALASYQDFRYKDATIRSKELSNVISGAEMDNASMYFHNRAKGTMYDATTKGEKAIQAKYHSKVAEQLENYSVDAAKANIDNVKSVTKGRNLENDLNELLKPYGFTTKDHPVIRTILTVMQKDNPNMNAIEAIMMLPEMLRGIDASQRIITK